MKELEFRKLKEQASTAHDVRAIRDGVDNKIPIHDVVVGDVLPLFTGIRSPLLD